MLNKKLQPQNITDLVENIDLFLEEMRENQDLKEIPNSLTNYIWGYFRDINPDKEKLKVLALFLADRTYRYAAEVRLIDEYTKMYFASVFTVLWDTIQSRGVDTFYILDNELRDDKFMLTILFFALSSVAVVTPYVVKGSYQKYMTIEEQAGWALSFTAEDFDPKRYSITLDSSEILRNIEIIDLIREYMTHTRNILYIEKDSTVNYLEEVKKIATESKYMSIFRNKAPTDPNVIVLNNQTVS